MFGRPAAEANVPPRRRRRPALSCTECRRRKIKCDRNLPCNHCAQSKNAVCTYPGNHSVAANRHSSIRASSNLGSPGPLAELSETSPGIPPPRLEAGASWSQRVPDVVHVSQSGTDSWDSSPRGGTENSFSDKNVQNLVDRVRRPEPAQGNAASSRKEGDENITFMGISFSTFEDVIVQDGDSRNILRTKTFKHGDKTPIQDLRGNLCKTRFYGQSHWMHSFHQFPKFFTLKDADGNPTVKSGLGEIREALEKCKSMARAAKAERPIKWHMNPNFKDYIPAREMADELVNLYLRTCESAYRIVHIPSFKREYAGYWNDPQGASTSLAVKLVLIMAIGTCFYQGDGNEELRSMAQQWVYSAQSWVAAPFEKARLNISGIQIHCLLLLARQTNAVGGDLIWTASGNLLRTAFSMGFHRDPKYFPKMSIFEAEMRRRIWATVLEMTVQTSFDAGMPPLITVQDFDTEPPSNIDDEDLDEHTALPPTPKPEHVYTRTSVQIELLKSLKTRLEISQLINNFRSEPSYDEVIRYGQDITKACNNANRLMKSYPASLPRPTALQRNLLDILVRRFLIHVHRPFAVRSQSDPRYYFSRKVCVDAALVIFFHSGAEDLPADHPPHVVDDYTRLKTVGGGFFKEVIVDAAIIIIIELIHQLEEDAASGLPPSAASRAARAPQYQALHAMIDLAAARIRMGENNVKGHLFLSAAAGQVDALTTGAPPERCIAEAATRSAQFCLELLRARTKNHPPLDQEPPHQEQQQQQQSQQQQSQQQQAAPPSLDNESPPSLGDDFGFDFLMPDIGANLDMPDSWLFSAWDGNTML